MLASLVVIWLLAAATSLALTGAVIYVAVHFLAKFW